MGLRDKYNAGIQAAKGHMEGAADEREGKLYFHGTPGQVLKIPVLARH